MDVPNYPNSFSVHYCSFSKNQLVVDNLVTFRWMRLFTLTFIADVDAPLILERLIVATFYVPTTLHINPLMNMSSHQKNNLK